MDSTGGEESRSALPACLIAAGATIATDCADWADADQDHAAVRRSGLLHAAANGDGTALMTGSYLARKQGARGRGRALALAGSGALGAGGWLGGHLSYTLGAGMTAGAAPSG